MGVVANLVIRVRADITEFEKHVNSLEKTFGRVGGKLQTIGSNLTRSVTLPLAAIGGGAVKAAMDFESSFAGVRKTVNATEAEFAQLSQGFRDMAKTIPVSVNELNRIGESAGQLGIKKENILGFTRVIAALGVTTNLSTEEAASSLAKFANITQMPQEQFDRLGSTIVALGNNFATTESDIVEFGLRIAGAGELAGLTEAQILSIGTALSSVGIKAEAGGTAVQKMLLGMTEAVATGGKDLAVFAATAGLSTKAFQQLFRTDAAEAFTRFVEGLGTQGQEAFKTLEALGMSDERLMRSFLSLAGAGDLLRNSVELGTQAWQQNTALTKEAEERYKTFASQVQVLWNWMYDLAITLGRELIDALLKMRPAIETVLSAITNLVTAFANMSEGKQTFIIAIAAAAAALGPFLFALGQIIISLGSVLKLMKLLPGGLLLGKYGGLLAGGVVAGEAGAYLHGKIADWWSGGSSGPAPKETPYAPLSDSLGLPGENLSTKGLMPALETFTKTARAAATTVKGLGVAAGGAAKKLLVAKNLGGWGASIYPEASPGLMGTGEIPSWLAGDLPSRALNTGFWTPPRVTSQNLLAGTATLGLGGLFTGKTGMAFGSQMVQTVIGALQGGGDIGKSLATGLGSQIYDYVAGAKGQGMELSGLGKALGLAGAGIGAYFTGFGVGQQTGSKGKGMLAGAAQGALMGTMIMPGIGTAVGALAGLIGGWIGAAGAAKKARQEFINSAGGLDKVREMAQYAGFNLDKLLSSKKKNVVEAEIKKLEKALKETQERVQKLITDLDTTLKAGGIITTDLWKGLAKDIDKKEVKDAFVETFKKSVQQAGSGWAQIAQSLTRVDAAGLGNLGVLAEAAFSGMATSGLTVAEILKVLGPGLQNVNKLLAESGLSATGFLGELLGWQTIVETNQPLFDQLAGINDMMVGLANSGLMTQETFSALGSMITGAFGQLTAQGVAGTTALQMMQPQLQNLWQLMTQFGFSVDEGTQALIDQGLEAGIIGTQFKDIQSQILDVLKAIAQVLGADIPNAFGAATQAATGFKAKVNETMDAVRGGAGPVLSAPGEPVDLPSYASGSGGLRDFGSGTLAMLHGNEAVLTDEQLAAASRPSLTFNISSLDPRGVRDVIEQEIAPYLAEVYSGNMGGLRSRTRTALGVAG